MKTHVFNFCLFAAQVLRSQHVPDQKRDSPHQFFVTQACVPSSSEALPPSGLPSSSLAAHVDPVPQFAGALVPLSSLLSPLAQTQPHGLDRLIALLFFEAQREVF